MGGNYPSYNLPDCFVPCESCGNAEYDLVVDGLRFCEPCALEYESLDPDDRGYNKHQILNHRERKY
jgi:hypothetical protein